MEQNYLIFAVIVWIVTIIMGKLNGRMYKQIIRDLMDINGLRTKLADKEAVNALLNQHIANLDAMMKPNDAPISTGSTGTASTETKHGTYGIPLKDLVPTKTSPKKSSSTKKRSTVKSKKQQLNG